MMRRVLVLAALVLASVCCRADQAGARPPDAANPVKAASAGAPSQAPGVPSAGSAPTQSGGSEVILDPRHLREGSSDERIGPGGSSGLFWPLTAVCLFGGLWLFLRGRRIRRPGTPNGALAITETRSLGNRQYLVVAACGRRRFLIGVCPGSISLLSPLEEDAPPT